MNEREWVNKMMSDTRSKFLKILDEIFFINNY